MTKITNLFGDRIAVRLVEEEFEGLLVPAPTQQRMYMLSRIVAVGDKAQESSDNYAVDDIIFWQWNGFVEQHNAFRVNGERIFVLMRGDLIARLSAQKVTLENFSVLGDWVLVRRTVHQPSKLIVLPDQVAQANQEMTMKFHVEQLGKNVELPLKKGQEVIVDRARTNPLTIGDTDFGYVHKSSVLGLLGETAT
jgi:co-chaperonin GroES (HSP10)